MYLGVIAPVSVTPVSVTLVGFFVFAFFPAVMQGSYGWVPYVGP
jgi:hypothetical protein